MDDTTPPVTKIYLVSLIYTPKKKTNALTFTTGRKGEKNPAAVRRGIIPSRKPLLRHTCMDLYHTTSGVRMKQEIAQRYPTRRHLAPCFLPRSTTGWSCCGTLGVMATARLCKASGNWLYDVGLPGMDLFASAHED